MSRIEARLEELGLTLPAPMLPPGNFKLVKVYGGLAYISGHPAIDGSTVLVQGVVGRDLTVEDPEFHDNAKVVNGVSDLIIEIWGEAGRHARSAPGQGPLPLDVR